MRGSDEVTGSLFSYVDLEERIPSRHPLRKIRSVVNDALGSLDAEFDRLYAGEGRPSIALGCKSSTRSDLSGSSWSRWTTTCCSAGS